MFKFINYFGVSYKSQTILETLFTFTATIVQNSFTICINICPFCSNIIIKKEIMDNVFVVVYLNEKCLNITLLID